MVNDGGHSPGDLNRTVSQVLHAPVRIPSYDTELYPRNLSAYGGPNLLTEKFHRIDVRLPIHGSHEYDQGLDFAIGKFRLVLTQVHAGGHNRHARWLDPLRHEGSV